MKKLLGAQHCRTADTSHILEADLLCAALDELLSQVDVVLGVVYLRIGDTHCSLSGHAGFLGPLD